MLQQFQANKNGQFFQSDFPDNIGGTNLVDSVFKIQSNQAAYGSFNFDYVLTGGIRKRLGPALINSVADSQTNTLGFGLYAPTSGTSKSVFRAAGTKFQLFNTGAPSFTALSQDNAGASSNPFTSGTTQDVLFAQFSNGTNDILWAAGGGATLPVGAYSTSKYTVNGAAAPTGTMSATNNTSGAGSWSTGNYGEFYYAVVLHKASTGALSNAALDCTVTTTNTLTDTVTINLASVVVSDTTTYDQFWIYRSALNGVSGFTTGSLIAKIPSTSTSFTDKGDLGNPDLLSSQNIPRSGNTVLDNSVLPSQTYNVITNWSNRLVTASGNNLYISDVNKSESWPLTNYITIPSAGPITALANISFTSPQANALQDLLVIFKERELWVLSGTSYSNWNLVKIDNTGCPYQNLVVSAQGFLAWIDFRGIHLWDGTSKPIYCSRPLEPLFTINGDLDKSKLNLGVGAFFRRENQIIWYLSSKTYGAQKFAIKMDVRLTLLQIEQNLTGRTIDAVLIQDTYKFPIYACLSYIPLGGSNEQMVLGDNSGYCYFASNGQSDSGNGIDWTYVTAPLSMGDPNTEKSFVTVIAWVQDVGNWNLELDYWTNYRVGAAAQTSQALPLTTENQQAAALWDIGVWDAAYWDSYQPNVVPIIFNLQSGNVNATQGSAIQLQFKNTNANQPVTIHGFSVLWSPMGGKASA